MLRKRQKRGDNILVEFIRLGVLRIIKI